MIVAGALRRLEESGTELAPEDQDDPDWLLRRLAKAPAAMT